MRRYVSPDVRDAATALTVGDLAATAEWCPAASAQAAPTRPLPPSVRIGNGCRPLLAAAVPALRHPFGNDPTPAASAVAVANGVDVSSLAAGDGGGGCGGGGGTDGGASPANANIALWCPTLSTPGLPIDGNVHAKTLDAFASTVIGNEKEPDAKGGGMGGWDDEADGIRDCADNGSWSDEKEVDVGGVGSGEDQEHGGEGKEVDHGVAADEEDGGASEDDGTAAVAAGSDADRVPAAAADVGAHEGPHKPLSALSGATAADGGRAHLGLRACAATMPKRPRLRLLAAACRLGWVAGCYDRPVIETGASRLVSARGRRAVCGCGWEGRSDVRVSEGTGGKASARPRLGRHLHGVVSASSPRPPLRRPRRRRHHRCRPCGRC